MAQSIGPSLRSYWNNLSGKPGGKWLFSRLVGKFAPYSGTIGANVQVLEPGHGIITLQDRYRVRNHLRSIHAIALVNLAELVTGLTLMSSLPDNTRGILVGISINYHKKARGLLTAECNCPVPGDNREQKLEIIGEIRDADGDLVATGRANWLIGPEKAPNQDSL
jgi:acyl-coenzyme A thioesterase PaaI-like protein